MSNRDQGNTGIEIYQYTNHLSGDVEYSADDDKYKEERIVDIVSKKSIMLGDLEYLLEYIEPEYIQMLSR